jgi:hypothetical protein
MGIPMRNVIREKDAPFAHESTLQKHFFRFGFHVELAHTSYNATGNGHRFGVRYQFDTSVIESLTNASMSLVHYHSVGVFYNLINDRFFRKKSK